MWCWGLANPERATNRRDHRNLEIHSVNTHMCGFTWFQWNPPWGQVLVPLAGFEALAWVL